jgi:hypothetical protein
MSSSGGVNVRDITLNLRRNQHARRHQYHHRSGRPEVSHTKTAPSFITPIDAPIGNIITRMYPVQPSFMDVIVERQSPTTKNARIRSSPHGRPRQHHQVRRQGLLREDRVKFPPAPRTPTMPPSAS